jgi:hypothetical protein
MDSRPSTNAKSPLAHGSRCGLGDEFLPFVSRLGEFTGDVYKVGGNFDAASRRRIAR